MRMTIILASICAFLVSCATLTGGGEGQQPQEQTSLDGSSPSLETPTTAPAGSTEQASYSSSPDMGGDSSQPVMEAQQAEHQTAQVDAMNEQRSTSELDAAAPESTSSGTDSFYASSQPVAPEVEQVTSAPPSELPQKQVASWDQHTQAPSYQEEKPMPVKKSKKIAKKHEKKKIAKHSKKSKKEIAKHSSKKSKKAIAKKSKVDCKKVAKNTKKSSKREIAMCKAEIKKVAKHKKSGKTGKVAQAGCQCNYR